MTVAAETSILIVTLQIGCFHNGSMHLSNVFFPPPHKLHGSAMSFHIFKRPLEVLHHASQCWQQLSVVNVKSFQLSPWSHRWSKRMSSMLTVVKKVFFASYTAAAAATTSFFKSDCKTEGFTYEPLQHTVK